MGAGSSVGQMAQQGAATPTSPVGQGVQNAAQQAMGQLQPMQAQPYQQMGQLGGGLFGGMSAQAPAITNAVQQAVGNLQAAQVQPAQGGNTGFMGGAMGLQGVAQPGMPGPAMNMMGQPLPAPLPPAPNTFQPLPAPLPAQPVQAGSLFGIGNTGQFPPGVDPRAVQANQQAYLNWQNEAKAREAQMSGSTMFGPQPLPGPLPGELPRPMPQPQPQPYMPPQGYGPPPWMKSYGPPPWMGGGGRGFGGRGFGGRGFGGRGYEQQYTKQPLQELVPDQLRPLR